MLAERKKGKKVMSNNKRVILISGRNSGWYEQAIFIINENCKKMPVDMVKEAENIIKKYIESTNKKGELFSAYKTNTPEKKLKNKKDYSNKMNSILNAVLILCAVMICFLIYLVFKL